MKTHATVIIVALLVLVMTGCQPWQGFRNGIEGAALFSRSAHAVLEAEQPRIDADTTAELVPEYERQLVAFRNCQENQAGNCVDPGTVDEWVERWRQRTSLVSDGITAIDELNAWIVTADEAAQRWRATNTDDPPEVVRAACSTADAVFDRVLSILRLLEVEYPEELDRVREYLVPACDLSLVIFAHGGAND